MSDMVMKKERFDILIKKAEEDSRIKNKAKKLLKNKLLFFAHTHDKLILCMFADKKNEKINVKLNTTEETVECEFCPVSDCVHAVAAALHYKNTFLPLETFIAKKKISKRSSEPLYSGLKKENLGVLVSEIQEYYPGRVEIEMKKSSPHAPSKWEKCELSVTLRVNNKTYSGNIANLRNLNFEKGVAAGLNIRQFPPQDRQIIRFLALNAESESRVLVLSAESLAEFFHCLPGFKHLVSDGKNLFVHKENVEPLLVFKTLNGECVFKPVISDGKSFIGLKNAKMIVGRAGCWIGIADDYWWVPGAFDIVWMRNFMRFNVHRCSPEEGRSIITRALASGLRVENKSVPDAPPLKRCHPLYSADYNESGHFEVILNFAYGELIPSNPGPNIIHLSNSIYQRDREYEFNLEQELFAMGFTRKKKSYKNIFSLKTGEAAGLFLDEVLPKWIAGDRDIFISGKLSSMLSGIQGVKTVSFKSGNIQEFDDYFEIDYSVNAEGVTWKDLIKTNKNNSVFILKSDKVIGKIPPPLQRFISAVGDIVQILKDKTYTVKVARNSAIFWAEAYYKLNSYVPFELQKLLGGMPDAPDDAFGILNSSEVGEKKKSNISQAEDDIYKSAVLTCEQSSTYKYQLNADLRTYQKEGVIWMRSMLKNRINVILADEMGLGKTIQTLALILDSMNSEPEMNSTPSLILCPSSLVDNWQIEADKFAPQLSSIIIRGNKRGELFKKIENVDIVIASYSIAARELEKLSKFKYRYLILDEAQRIKNPGTLNAKTSKSINAFHKVVLTGTPLENSPDELWSIFDFLQPKMLGSLAAFKKRYADIHNKKEIQNELAIRTSPFILRRRKADVEPDLPEKIQQNIYCEMLPEQRNLYEECRDQGLNFFHKLIKSGKNSRFDLLTNILRLRQICCHPALINPDKEALMNISSAKTELLKELLIESMDSGHKILLFSQFTSFLSIIRKWLDDNDMNYEYLDGGTKDRMTKVNKFNENPDISFFLLSLKAGGVGLNLTSADRVIIYDPWWNPAVEAQATDRTHRIGQTNSVYSMKLIVKNSIEEKILKLQDKKQKIFRNLLDRQSDSLKQLTNEDLEFLLS